MAVLQVELLQLVAAQSVVQRLLLKPLSAAAVAVVSVFPSVLPLLSIPLS